MVQMMKSSLMMCSMSKRFLFKMMISNKKRLISKKLLKKRTSKRFLKKRLSKKTSKR